MLHLLDSFEAYLLLIERSLTAYGTRTRLLMPKDQPHPLPGASLSDEGQALDHLIHKKDHEVHARIEELEARLRPLLPGVFRSPHHYRPMFAFLRGAAWKLYEYASTQWRRAEQESHHLPPHSERAHHMAFLEQRLAGLCDAVALGKP
jgi:hypothetical protein